MKQPFGIIIVIVFFGYQVLPSIIYIDFKVNQDFITSVFCINKEQPQKGCNGQCHLKNTLEQNVPSEKPEKENRTVYRKLLQLKPSEFSLLICEKNGADIALTVHKDSIPPIIYLDGIFHPPQIFVL